jgi:beta-lactamase class C
MPMVFDDLLGLQHVDWADIEGTARSTAAKPKPKHKPRVQRRAPRHR